MWRCQVFVFLSVGFLVLADNWRRCLADRQLQHNKKKKKRNRKAILRNRKGKQEKQNCTIVQLEEKKTWEAYTASQMLAGLFELIELLVSI